MLVGSCRGVARLDQFAPSRAQDGSRIPKVSQTTIEPFPALSARQAFDVPKRAGSEAALGARKPVHVGAFRLVAMDKGIFDEPCFNRFSFRAPHRIHRANEPHEWQKQDRRIQVPAPLRLYKRLQIVIPEVRKDVLSNRVARSQPSVEWPGQGAFLCKPQGSMESYPD